jgi:hypothetical protein
MLTRRCLFVSALTLVMAAAANAQAIVTGFVRDQATNVPYYTGAELEAQHVQRLAEAFDRIPSARIVRGNGTAAWVVNSRPGRRLTPVDAGDKIRGAKPGCCPNVFVDGVQVYHGRNEEPLFDINSIRPDELEGMEYFAGPSETPALYMSLDMSCGVAVIYTKRDQSEHQLLFTNM